MSELKIRPAKTTDVLTIRKLVDTYAPDRRLLSKATVTLYEAVPDFLVIEKDGQIIGAGAVHVLWEDLAEVKRRSNNWSRSSSRFMGRLS